MWSHTQQLELGSMAGKASELKLEALKEIYSKQSEK
jgi:hypothetical protein